MEWILANLKEIAIGVGGIWATIYTIIEKHKEVVSWIALRIEKDSADGKWTNKEKEDMAVDLYFQKIIPSLPLQWKLILKMIPNFVEEKLVRSLVKKTCSKAKKISK